MIPVKIKFSNLVRSNSPLKKSRLLNDQDSDSLQNIIKYIPIQIKKECPSPLSLLPSQLGKSSAGVSNNDKLPLSRGSQSGVRKIGQGQSKVIHRSLSNRKKKGVRGGNKDDDLKNTKNQGFYSQLHECKELNLTNRKQFKFHPNNSLSSPETTGNCEKTESPVIFQQKLTQSKHFFMTTTNQLIGDKVSSSPKNREFSNISQPSTESTCLTAKMNTPSPPLFKRFYQTYLQISQDSQGDLNQGFFKGNSPSKLQKEKQPVVVLKYREQSAKQRENKVRENSIQSPTIDAQSGKLSRVQINNLLENQTPSKLLPLQTESMFSNQTSSQQSEGNKRPLVIKVDIPQSSSNKYNNSENNQLKDSSLKRKPSILEKGSPTGTGQQQKRQLKEICDQQQESDKSPQKLERIMTAQGKRKSSLKLKKHIKNKHQPLLQQQQYQQQQIQQQQQQIKEQNNVTPAQTLLNLSQKAIYYNSLFLSEKNNIQLMNLKQIKTTQYSLNTSEKASAHTPTAMRLEQMQDNMKLSKKPSSETHFAELTQTNQINISQFISSSHNSNKDVDNILNVPTLINSQKKENKLKSENLPKIQQKANQPSQSQKNTLEQQQDSLSQNGAINQEPKQHQHNQNQNQTTQQIFCSQERKKQMNENIDSLPFYDMQNDKNTNSKDLKNAQKIFYDLPPQYSNRIKYRKLSRIYYKPRNYFRGSNVAVIHFDGVLGVYDNPFFSFLKSSDSQLPQNYESAQDTFENDFKSFSNEIKLNTCENGESNNLQQKGENNLFNKTFYPECLQGNGRPFFNNSMMNYSDFEQPQKSEDENENTRFKKEQLYVLKNLKQTLKKISQWYFVILILPFKSGMWLEIRDYLIEQHFFCDAMYTYDNETYDYTSYNKRNKNNIFIKNPEFKIQTESSEDVYTTHSKTDNLSQENKTFSQNMFFGQPGNSKVHLQKEIITQSFSGTSYKDGTKSAKDSDSSNNSYCFSQKQEFLDLELLIDYNQILLDLKMNQPKKVLMIDTLPFNMKECYQRVEDRATFFKNEKKVDDLNHHILFLRLKNTIWRTFSLKFPKIKCHKSALRVVYLPSLYFEQKKFSSSSISFQSVLLEEIAQEFQEETNEVRYIQRNKQRWYYLNLNDIFSEFENQKLKECFSKHMKSGQTDLLLKQPQQSIYKQEVEQSQYSEQTMKQKIHRYFQQNNIVQEYINKDQERVAQQTGDTNQVQQNTNNTQSNSNNNNNTSSNSNSQTNVKKSSSGFQCYLNNIVDILLNRNSKIMKQFTLNRENFQQAQQVQKIYSSFYDKNSHWSSKQQQSDKIEKELDLYIARKYKFSFLFYFSSLQNSLSITLFFLIAFLA